MPTPDLLSFSAQLSRLAAGVATTTAQRDAERESAVARREANRRRLAASNKRRQDPCLLRRQRVLHVLADAKWHELGDIADQIPGVMPKRIYDDLSRLIDEGRVEVHRASRRSVTYRLIKDT
jgi:hypothetical protein